MNDKNIIDFEEDVNQLFAYSNILNILSNVSSFKVWLKSYHKIDDDTLIVKGYAYNVLICLRCIIDAIRSNTLLGLQEDFVLYRANFKGINIEEVPNTCEKIIFLKKIWYLSKKLFKVKSWEDIESYFKLIEPLLEILNQIYQEEVKTKKKISKDEALLKTTKFYLFIFQHDISKGYPKGAFVSGILDDDSFTHEKILKESYIGYIYSLQYIWYELLEQDFEQTSLKNLNLLTDFEEFKKVDLKRIFINHISFCSRTDFNIISKKLFPTMDLQINEEISEIDLKELLENANERNINGVLSSIFSNNTSERIKLKELIEQISIIEINDKIHEFVERFFYWEPLDKFFGIVKDELYEPPVNLYMQNIDLKSIFDKNKIKLEFDGNIDVNYLNSEDETLIFKKIDFDFFWYKMDILDTQKSNIFNGVPAFLSVMNGLTQIVRREFPDEKIRVTIIKHPHPDIENAFDYSFSVLIPISGLFTDSSGWLVFYDCAGDYSGTAGDLYMRAMKDVIELAETEQIIYNEVIIEKEIFRKYIPTRAVSSVFDNIINFEDTKSDLFQNQTIVSFSEINSKLERFVNDTRGKLFEFLMFKWLMNNEVCNDIQCDITLVGEQIDCLLFKDNSIEIYECKINLHSAIDSYLIQAKRKEKKIQKEYPSCEIKTIIAVYHEVEPVRKNLLQEKGFKVLDNFRTTFELSRSFAGSIRDIRRILEKF